jgi:hypothetical protein
MSFLEVNTDRFLEVKKEELPSTCYSCAKVKSDLVSIAVHYENNQGISGDTYCYDCLQFIFKESAIQIHSPMKEGKKMDTLIKQAEDLRKAIKRQEKEIDNPALVKGFLSELDFFIENVKED